MTWTQFQRHARIVRVSWRSLLISTLLLLATPLFAATDENGQPLPPGEEAATDADAADATADEGSGDNEGDSEGKSDENTEAEIVVIPRVLPDEERNRHNGVVRFLEQNNRSGELVRMVAGEDEFYGLFLSETRGQPQGGILILHDTEQHGHWPYLVAPLRQQLPTHGWATLSIELPTPPASPIPPRPVYEIPVEDEEADEEQANDAEASAATEPAENETTNETATDSTGVTEQGQAEQGQAEETDATNDNEPPLPRLTELPASEETPPEPDAVKSEPEISAEDAFRDAMMARIRQGVAYLNQRGQLNIVVIATGSSAGWAAEYMQQKPATIVNSNGQDGEEKGYTLVLVDAVDHRLNAIPLTQRLVDLELPILDLVSSDGISSDYQINYRAGQMRHRQRGAYQQIKVPELARQYEDNRLIRRIRGWLKTHAAGTELPSG